MRSRYIGTSIYRCVSALSDQLRSLFDSIHVEQDTNNLRRIRFTSQPGWDISKCATALLYLSELVYTVQTDEPKNETDKKLGAMIREKGDLFLNKLLGDAINNAFSLHEEAQQRIGASAVDVFRKVKQTLSTMDTCVHENKWTWPDFLKEIMDTKAMHSAKPYFVARHPTLWFIDKESLKLWMPEA